jgi:hypothetical protein
MQSDFPYFHLTAKGGQSIVYFRIEMIQSFDTDAAATVFSTQDYFENYYPNIPNTQFPYHFPLDTNFNALTFVDTDYHNGKFQRKTASVSEIEWVLLKADCLRFHCSVVEVQNFYVSHLKYNNPGYTDAGYFVANSLHNMISISSSDPYSYIVVPRHQYQVLTQGTSNNIKKFYLCDYPSGANTIGCNNHNGNGVGSANRKQYCSTNYHVYCY